MVETRWRYGMFALIAASVGLFGCNDLTGVDDAETDDENATLEAAPRPAPVTSYSCTYPSAGNVGVGQGQFVPQNVQLSNGYLPNSDVLVPSFAFAETYDCDGSKGYHAIAIDTSQYG